MNGTAGAPAPAAIAQLIHALQGGHIGHADAHAFQNAHGLTRRAKRQP
jgi:hypothetical protein